MASSVASSPPGTAAACGSMVNGVTTVFAAGATIAAVGKNSSVSTIASGAAGGGEPERMFLMPSSVLSVDPNGIGPNVASGAPFLVSVAFTCIVMPGLLAGSLAENRIGTWPPW